MLNCGFYLREGLYAQSLNKNIFYIGMIISIYRAPENKFERFGGFGIN